MTPITTLLPPELDQFVSNLVQTGDFANRDQVICEALQRLKQRREEMERLKLEIAKGVEQADRGELGPFHLAEIKAEGRRLLAEKRGDAHATDTPSHPGQD